MKKVVLFLAACAVASFAQQDAGRIECSVYSSCRPVVENGGSEALASDEETPLIRGGFYLDLTVSGMFNHFEEHHEYETNYYNSLESSIRNYYGGGPGFSLKLGGISRSRLAGYFMVDYSFSYGSTESERVSKGRLEKNKANTSSKRLVFGGGAMVFPSLNLSSSMYGTFVGLSAGLEFSSVSSSLRDDVAAIRGSGLGFKFEFGKLWQVSDRVFMGGLGALSLDLPVHYDTPVDDSTVNYGLWFGFKIVRK